MKLDKKASVAGYPMLKIRDFLKHHQQFTFLSVTGFFEVSHEKAVNIIDALLQDGYIQSIPENERVSWDNDYEQYEHSVLGRSLALAKAVPPMKWEKAEKLLQEFMGRVSTVNESEEYLIRVKKVLVFGSYLRKEVTELNDLDLAVELGPKYSQPLQQEKEEALVEQAVSQGKIFSSFIDQLCYSETLVKMFLKNRSRWISLHSMGDQVLEKTEVRQLFP